MSLQQDLRLATGQLKRRPGFVLGATISLAIGMALATALFSILDSVVRRPIPYSEPDRLIAVVTTVGDYANSRVSPRLLTTLRQGTSSLSKVAGYTGTRARFGKSGEARYIAAANVTTDFFDVLRTRPARGRTFDPSTGVTGDRSVVISYSFWQAQFGADPQTVGRSIPINGVAHTVIGILPESFDLPHGTQLWLPLPDETLLVEANSTRDSDWSPYYAIARLGPGSSIESTNAELDVVFKRLYGANPDRRLQSARAELLGDFLTADIRDQLRLWSAAAILILILCAVNFATMSLARGMRRRADIAVRSALGASPRRIVRMIVTEAVLLAAIGGIMSLFLAGWLLSAVTALIGEGPLAISPSISWMTVAFSIAGTVGVGLLFALAPALELAKVDLRSLISGGGANTPRQGELRGRVLLVALQLSLALTAVAVVTALIKADRRYRTVSTGFDYSHLIVADIGAADMLARRISAQPLLDHLAGSSGIGNVAAVGSMDPATLLTARGLGDDASSYLSAVSPEFFRVLGVTPVAGRLPSDEEVRSAAPVVVMSERTAGRVFGSAMAAAGQPIRMKLPRHPAERVIVVGVVPEIGGGGLYFGAPLYRVRPLREERAGTLLVRVDGYPQTQIKGLIASLTTFDEGIWVGNVRTARSVVDRVQNASAGRVIFLSIVAVLALVLAIVGVYGLTSYTTELRARELAIRIALGAKAGDVAKAVVGDLWWMAAVGIGSGVFVSTRLVSFLDALFRNPMVKTPLVTLPIGPTVASGVTLVIIMVCGTAVPLRRVLSLDVMRSVQGGST